MNLRIVSLNMHKGFDIWGVQFILQNIRQGLRQLDADVVFLQEVVGENTRLQKTVSSWPTEAQFEFLADSVWSHFSYGKNAVFTDSHHGNAILSKYPIIMSENIDISNSNRERRGLLHCQIMNPNSPARPLNIFNTHLDLFSRGRRQQVHRIIQRAKENVESNGPFILAGDFNDWPGELTKPFEEGLGVKECFIETTGRHAVTFPSILPIMTLDRIYYRGLQINTARVLRISPWNRLSDHLPLFAEFKI